MDGCLSARRIRAIVVAALALFPGLARADRLNNEWISTTRNLSMGNVGIASSEDPTSAMFYNPAALSRARGTNAELFNPQFDLGLGAFSHTGVLKLPNNLSLEKIQPELQKSPGKASSLGFSLYPNFYTRNFNIGILMSAQGSAYYNGTETIYQSRYLVMPTAALTGAILNGRLRLGVAARAISITENNRQSTATSGIGYRVDAESGFGWAMDAGLLLALPTAGLPTVGIVARNIGQTQFPRPAKISFAEGTRTAHDAIPMTVDLGFAVFPKLNTRTTLSLAADYRDVLDVNQVKMMRHLNLGAELGLNKTVYFRGGVSRGYWTAGFGLNSRAGSLDIGSYAEELETKDFRRREDRRVSIRYGRKF